MNKFKNKNIYTFFDQNCITNMYEKYCLENKISNS